METIDTPPFSDERDEAFGPQREMSEVDFEAMRVAIRDQALSSVAALGSVAPALFLPTLDDDGDIVRMGLVPIEEMMGHSMGTQVLEMVTAKLLLDPNHDFAILLHEAWTLSANSSPEEALKTATKLAASGGSLAELEGSGEAVVMRLQSKNRQAMCVMPITRDAQGAIESIADEPLIFMDAPGVTVGSPNVAFPEGPPLDTSRPRGATLH